MARFETDNREKLLRKTEDSVRAFLQEQIDRAEVYLVSVKSLIVEKNGVGIDDRSVDRLLESGKRRGGWIHYPVVQKSSMKVIAGKRRVLADKKAQKEKTLVRIVDIDDKEAIFWRLDENTYRFNPDLKERYHSFASLQRDHNLTQAEIAHASGLSQNYVSKILAWGNGGFKGSPGRIFTVNNSESGKGGVEGTEVGGSEASSIDRGPEGSPPAAPDSLPVAPMKEPPEEVTRVAASGEMLPPSPPATLDADKPHLVGGASSFLEAADSFSGGEETPIHLKASLRSGSEPIPPTPAFSLPTGHWELAEIVRYRGNINGYIASAIKYAKDDESTREHLETIYEAIGKGLRK